MSVKISADLIEFVAKELKVSPSRLRPNTRLLHDLGVDGDDGDELMEAFAQRFDVDLTGCDLSLHFGPEAGGNPFVWAWWLVTRTWPKLVPITLSDLQASIDSRRWVSPQHAAEAPWPFESQRGSVTSSLAASFVMWWLLWLAAWLSRLENAAFALLAPVLPIYYGVVFMAHRDLDMAFASLGISALTLIFVALAILMRAPKAFVIAAHLFVCLYWVWSLALVAMGV